MHEFDDAELRDFLLHRYSNIEYVLNLPAMEGIELIQKGYEKHFEELLWQRWLLDTLSMDENNAMDFDEYKNMYKKAIEKPHKKNDPVADAQKILKIRKKGR